MNLYEDIAKRTNGEIYIGVVGPVRSGKSTFVKKFMDSIVIPHMGQGYERERALDESPQSASGRTIMTTEPKFIPDEAVEVSINSSKMKVRLIDCVGYMVNGAIGSEEDGQTRMVMTPWDKEPMEFEKAAEFGTKKVITDHSTVGIVVTTDGTIGDIPRQSYAEAEERVINELKSINKPFVIVLNSSKPSSKEANDLAISLENKYDSPVALINALELNEDDFNGIIELLLSQFNINEIKFMLPKYFASIDDSHWLMNSILSSIRDSVSGTVRMCDGEKILSTLESNENICTKPSATYNLGTGNIEVKIDMLPELYYKIMSELCGFEIRDDEDLFRNIKSLAEAKRELDKFAKAIDDVNSTGYGIVLPSVEDMTLNDPEMVRQSGNYGVKLKASAPSIHMIKATIETEINPIVGTEDQSREIIKNMLDEIEDDPQRIWDFNMFGKSLYELVNDGLNTKLEHITPESRTRLSDTLARVINEGSNGLICIIL